MTAEKNTARGKKTKGKRRKTKETCKRGGDHRRPGGGQGETSTTKKTKQE